MPATATRTDRTPVLTLLSPTYLRPLYSLSLSPSAFTSTRSLFLQNLRARTEPSLWTRSCIPPRHLILLVTLYLSLYLGLAHIQQKWRRPSPLSRRGRRRSSATSRTATTASRSRGGSLRVSTTACVEPTGVEGPLLGCWDKGCCEAQERAGLRGGIGVNKGEYSHLLAPNDGQQRCAPSSSSGLCSSCSSYPAGCAAAGVCRSADRPSHRRTSTLPH